MSWGMRLPSRLLLTCLDLFVRCAEINQWSLEFVTRIHVHRRDRKTHRHEDTKRDNKKDWQTNKSLRICSMLNQVQHAPDVTSYSMCETNSITNKHSMRTLDHVRHHHSDQHLQQHAVCSSPKKKNALRVFFWKLQLAKGTICEMPPRVLNVFSV